MSIIFTRLKSIFILAVVVLMATQGVQAQKPATERVTGNVVTTDGNPASAVNVALKGTFYGAVTRDDGSFAFEAPAGSYTLSVFSITCHAKELPVVINKGEGNHFPNLSVIENTEQLETVVITGQFSPQSLSKSIYNVKVITSEEIEQKGAQDMQSLLNTEIGVRISNDVALGETDFEILGTGGNGVKVLVDGMPVIDRNSAKQSLSQIDISLVDRVEITEGPMSVIYGTDALSGVINIITKKPSQSSSKNNWGVNVSVAEETVGSEYEPFHGEGLHRQNVRLDWSGTQGLYALASATRVDMGGWQGDATGRELSWPGKEQWLLNGMVGYGNQRFRAFYKLDYSENKTLKYYNPGVGSTQMKDESFLTDRMNHQLHSEWNINNRVSLNSAVSYQNLERRTRTVITDGATGEKWLSDSPAAQDTAKMQDFFARATVTWGITPKISMQGGADIDWTKASGDRIEGSPTITNAAAYVAAEWEATDWLDVRPGLRTEYNSVYSAPPAIPSLQTKFKLNPKMDLRLSYGYGFRAPKLRELYFRFVNDNHDVSGNPDLKAEHSNNYSGAFTWRILHEGDLRLTSTATLFYNDFRNRIVTIITDPSSTPMRASYGNRKKTSTMGGTLENNLVWKELRAGLSFSMIGTYNTLKDEAKYKGVKMDKYKYSPELSANVSYKFRKTGTGLNLFYKYTHSDRYYSTQNDQVVLIGMDSFHWADFTVTQKVGGYVTLTAAVKNIFDVTMVDNSAGGGMGSTGNASLQGYGRSFMLGASFSLTK